MPRHRGHLPPCDGTPFLTDGGIETTLIFHYGLELPCFASFPLLESHQGQTALRRYFRTYTDLAQRLGLGLVLESPTWRASPSWAMLLGFPLDRLHAIQDLAIAMMEEFRGQLDSSGLPSLISGDIGPRGDGYVVSDLMTTEEAEEYHRPQVQAFASTEADLPSLCVVGGCCGTDERHVEEACRALALGRPAGGPEPPLMVS